MSDDLTFHPGDSDNAVLRKILSKLNAGLTLVGNGELPFGVEIVAVANFPVLQQIYGNVGVTNFPGEFAVSNFPAGFNVNNFPATQTVGGTVAVSNLPATQPVSGSVSVSNFPATQPISAASLPLPSGAATEASLVKLTTLPQFPSNYFGVVDAKVSRTFHIMGRRAGFNSTSVLQDIGEWLSTSIDLLPELAGTEALEVVSSNAADAAAGTGTRTVKITYIDPITKAITTTADIVLDGTTPVSLGATRMLFVLWMEATTGGSSETSVGNIDLRTVAGSVIQERIVAGGNRSLSCRFMVPLGYTAYISSWQVTTLGTTADARLRATKETASRALGSRYIFQDNAFVAAGGNVTDDIPYLKYPALCKIKVSALVGSAPASNRIDSDFTITIIAD